MINPVALIMVAVLNEPRDLEIARLLGWYRIPLRSAPKVIGVDYLAFYQTGVFAQEKWRIQYLAEVRGYELTTRAELLREEVDHPHAQQEYFKVEIGPLQRLERPILAEKWKRITFFYTTGEYFQKAHTISDLVVDSSERQLLWHALRERAAQEPQGTEKDEPDLDLPTEALAVFLGIRDFEKKSY